MTDADKNTFKDIAGEFVNVVKPNVPKPLYFLGAFGIILSVGLTVQNSVEKTIHEITD